MTLQLADTAPDFEAETTEGPIRFHDWIGDSWAVLFSHPKDFTPGLHHRARLHGQDQARVRPPRRQDHRAVGRPGRATTRGGPTTSRRRRAHAPNYPMIGDADFARRPSSTGCCRPAPRGDPAKRTPADNQTVRNVFVIGPDKKIKLILVYPMTTGRNFDEVLRVDRLAAADRQAPGRDAGELEAGRGRDHRRLGVRRRGQADLSARLEGAAGPTSASCPSRAGVDVP